MSSLLALANKAPIVPTFNAGTLRTASAEVQQTYQWHAGTYVEQPALAYLREAFVAAVRNAQTPKACLIAPFGYGKTASAIGLWSACNAADLLVVPPISCGSFTELASAIYGWLAYTLTEQAQHLAEAHDRFLVSSAEALARYDERSFGIPFDQGLVAIRDKLERGYLDFDDVSINLLAFLEQATAVVVQAGYQGLVVMIDEFQQLLGNANKGVLVALRQLIWGLRTRQIPFGLLLTMDPDTERTLSDRAGDILHRIKDDGFYLDIRHIYDREFPAQLWQQYVTALDFEQGDQNAIDRPALDALGQLCERDDLSNGPRTVINVLQRVAARRTQGTRSGYSPIDLVNDLLDGTIRFDGDRGVVPAVVADLLTFPYFQRSTERTQVLKLVAAFPRGCPVETAQIYQLAEAWYALNDDLRGEIVTETEEGLALIALQRVGRPANRLNILLRRYWMQITDQQLFAEDAARTFRDVVLPLLFPPRMSDLNGWSGLDGVQLSVDDTYAGVLEGTMSPAFPLRRLALSIRSDTLAQEPEEDRDDIDLQLVFDLKLDPAADSSVVVEAQLSRIYFTLALARTSEQRLHASIGWIARYLSPHPLSAAVVLSLLRYLSRERLEALPERDRARMEDTLSRLREWLISELFPAALFASASYVVVSSGAGALKEFLFQHFSGLWPMYQPLARFPTWQALLNDYVGALKRVSLSAKLGEEIVADSKSQIAALFDQQRHAGFDSVARQYGDLLRLETWQGNQAAVRLVPHRAELRIAAQVREQGFLAEQAVYAELRQSGFAAVEARQLLRLALERGLIVRSGTDVTVPTAPTALEINTRAQALRQRAGFLGALPEELSAALGDFAPHQEQAAEAAWRLEQAERRVSELEAQAQRELKARRDDVRNRLLRTLPQLAAHLPEAPEGEFYHHLAAAKRLLEEQIHTNKSAAEAFVAQSQAASVEAMENLADRAEQLAQQIADYFQWVAFTHDLAAIYQAFQWLGTDVSEIKAIDQEIQKLVREARANFAEGGLPRLSEVDRLRPKLGSLIKQLEQLSEERRLAYERRAHKVVIQLTTLLGLSTNPTIPPYQADNNERSFQRLGHLITKIVNRSLALMEVALGEVDAADGRAKQQATRLRNDLRAARTRLADPQHILQPDGINLQKEAIKQIKRLRERFTEYIPGDRNMTTRKVIEALADLPNGPNDLPSLVQQLEGQIPQLDLLAHLLKLQEAGIVRLLIDLPERYEY